MPALVRSENDLPTLRVHLHTAGGRQPVAVFETLRGAGEAREVLQVPTEDLGLPAWVASSRDVAEERLHLRPGAAAVLARQLRALGDGSPAYWLELPSPRGYLHLLPWERLLSPALGRPLLRLPNFVLRPKAPGSSLRVAVVVAQVPGRPAFDVGGFVRGVVDAWDGSVQRDVFVEVFAGPDTTDAVRGSVGGRPRVAVHAPPDRPRGRQPGPGDHPWLRWIGSALERTAPDVGHLIGHGTLSGERGGVQLPPPDAASRTVGVARADDLVAALQQTGAWSLVVTAIPGNRCLPGLRDLVDAVAQRMPGVVALHDPDEAADSLAPALRMIYSAEAPPHPLPGLTCWTHPRFVEFPVPPSPRCRRDGTSVYIPESTQQVLDAVETPTWVAAGARVIESLHAQLEAPDAPPPDSRTLAALETVSAIFDEHVRTFAPGAEGGGDGGDAGDGGTGGLP